MIDATTTTTAALAVTGLTAGYGPIVAVRDVALAVTAGSTTALVGPNGAGKSTLLKAIVGLVKPQAGTVELDGRVINGLAAEDVARLGVALVPEGRGILGSLSVEDNLMAGTFALGHRGDPSRAVAALVGRFPLLHDRRSQQAGTLSGGQQQILAIARGLVSDPQVLLLDEPSLGLSPAAMGEVYQLLAELRAEGRTIVLVEQQTSHALQVADQVVLLGRGHVTAVTTPDRIAAGDDDVAAAYLGGRGTA